MKNKEKQKKKKINFMNEIRHIIQINNSKKIMAGRKKKCQKS